VTEALDPAVFVPAPGQGAIAIECRDRDEDAAAAIRPLQHDPTEAAVGAERTFLACLGGGCNVPLGAHAVVTPAGTLRLTAFVARPDGLDLLRGEATGHDPKKLGERLAEEMRAHGADRLLAS
jgi:hydroxymethylbilane synthase